LSSGLAYPYSQIMDADELRKRARRNQRDKTREAASYAALVDGIWAADDDGMRQADIVRAVDLTRERVRQICAPAYRARHRRQA
jgi:hypothetical protein